MSKAKYIGCGTVYILFILGMFVLSYFVHKEPVEKLAFDYIIENIQLFEGDINKMGYEVKVAYTWGEINDELDEEESKEKLGAFGRGILILSNSKEEYRFDIGFQSYNTDIDNKTSVFVNKTFDEKVLNLEKDKDYPVYVSLSTYENNKGKTYWNYYNLDFTKFSEVYADESIDDMRIKEHISSQELRQMLENGISLQNKLVDMYTVVKND